MTDPVTIETHTRRLRELAQLVREMRVEPPSFNAAPNLVLDMSMFGFHPKSEHAPAEQNYCGTRVCALGRASLHPRFREEGLLGRWMQSKEGAWELDIVLEGHEEKPWSAFKVAAIFFGLTPLEAGNAFGVVRNEDETPLEVADCLERLAVKREELGASPDVTL